MMKGLIDYMTFAYSFLCKGAFDLRGDDVKAIRAGANTIARTAPTVLKDESAPSRRQELTLAEAEMINQHIDECAEWLLRQEII